MSKIKFVLEKLCDDSTGQMIDTLIKIHPDGTREPWGNVIEFDQLFDSCVKRWGKNWDLEKVKVAISESQIK